MAYLTKEEVGVYKANGYILDKIPATEKPKTEMEELLIVEAEV
jgi:hypothetical protein